eukprot:s458_g11.t1
MKQALVTKSGRSKKMLDGIVKEPLRTPLWQHGVNLEVFHSLFFSLVIEVLRSPILQAWPTNLTFQRLGSDITRRTADTTLNFPSLDFPDEAKMELVKRFHPTFFGPDDTGKQRSGDTMEGSRQEAIMLRKAVLVIQKGIMGVRGRVLRRGDVLGLESILLETNSLIETSQPRTLSYCFVMVLKRDDLLEVARERAQIRAAVRRAFLTSAAQEKQDRKNRSSGDVPDLYRERSSRSMKRTFTQSHPPSFSGDLGRIAPVTPPDTPRDPKGPQNAQAIAYSKAPVRFSRINLEDRWLAALLKKDTGPPGQVSQESVLAAVERLETQNLKIQATQEIRQKRGIWGPCKVLLNATVHP